ncbi:unnamed protein product [Vicia faba]|uniref:Uncharacterized protein n=1 Tax=Vicia faba TaxID=3906 RepID=A0AAV0YCB0_VICFA|nr:unnamed protein product [Vicia faba]
MFAGNLCNSRWCMASQSWIESMSTRIWWQISAEGMKMCEVLQANFLIEKLLDSWSNYRNQQKHKKKDLNLLELVNHMNIELANRLKDKHVPKVSDNLVKASVVESSENVDRFKKDKKG